MSFGVYPSRSAVFTVAGGLWPSTDIDRQTAKAGTARQRIMDSIYWLIAFFSIYYLFKDPSIKSSPFQRTGEDIIG